MPNTGMLDHRAFQPTTRRSSAVHWFGAWPSQAGYRTARSFKVTNFSRHLIREMEPQLALSRQLRLNQSRPGTATTPRTPLGNSIAPFHTVMKPTCGHFFERETDNRKKPIGIPPTDLMSWRSARQTRSAPVRRA